MFTTTRIKIKGNDVYINKPALFGKKTDEHFSVIDLEQAVPTIRAFENNQLRRTFRLETLATNPDLTGQQILFIRRALAKHGVYKTVLQKKQYTSPQPSPVWFFQIGAERIARFHR